MPYTEFGVVEAPIIEWLQELGWKYVSSNELGRDTEEPFDPLTLKETVRRLNPVIVQTDSDVDKTINQLRMISNDINGNKEFFEWIKGERSIVLHPGEKAQVIRLIDPNSENNALVVTNQFTFSGYESVRFDVVLMVNGIPVVMIEAKVPTHEILDYHEAIKQIQRYNRDAPQLFKYLAFVCATDGFNFRYDWVTPDKFFEWKIVKYEDPLENSVKTLFNKDFFLDFFTNFIVFEREREQVRKKMAMYQQVTAANKIVARVLEGKTRSGLIWHTQGSGKSLTMLFAAWKLKKMPQLNNPTILLIVDRIDLQRQLWGTFSNVDLPYTSKAISTKDLISKLSKDSREVIITTIQKFEDVAAVLSQRENIIIFVDEAHRSQEGKLAMRMRQAFPNAFIFGFTGTPIEKGETGKSTFRAFCPPKEIYLDKYGITRSIEDGATLRLLYQPRLIMYHIPRETLDREFLGITIGLQEKDQEKVLEKSATLRTALKAKDRIEQIARDVAEHFTTHTDPLGFKAQLVAVDREACALYKEALDQHLPPEASTVIYTSSLNDDELLQKYHMGKEEQLKVARILFQKEGENPKILIVTDMLLTGFDAPIEQVMYLDKPMRDHKLLQAIARTNRPYPGKSAGVIIDYVGIFDNLKEALNFQEEDIKGVAYNYDVLKEEFTTIMTSALATFSGVTRDGTRTSLFSAMKILDDKSTHKEFKKNLSRLKRRYELIAPDPFLLQYDTDYTWLIEINEANNKLRNRKGPDLSDYQEKTKQLIREKLLVSKLAVGLPTFEIDKDYLTKLDNEGFSDEQKIMEIAEALKTHIRINIETNPIYETLSRRLDRILKTAEASKLLKELKALILETVAIEKETQTLGVSREEYALLNVAKKYVKGASDTELITFIKELETTIKAKLFDGWWKKGAMSREVEQTIFGECFKRFSGTLDVRTLSSLSEELMKFIVKYNP